jgi:hypothetical protein
MKGKKIAPWSWFKAEGAPTHATQMLARFPASSDPFAALEMAIERLMDVLPSLGSDSYITFGEREDRIPR